eukprot:895379-Prorocentrum_minimum.AAC.1
MGALCSDDFPLPAPVACAGGCAEVYCSRKCGDASWASYHRMLCAGEGGTEALRAFQAHADNTNDIFHVAAAVRAKASFLSLFSSPNPEPEPGGCCGITPGVQDRSPK